MNAVAYWIAVGFSLVLSMGLYGLRLIKRGFSPKAEVLALPLSAVFALVVGKALYVLLQYSYVWPRWGWAALLKMEPTQFSFLGGLIGVVLAVCLAGKAMHVPGKKNLDAFAPALALLFGLWKAAEYFQGDYGTGAYVENEGLQFFPLSTMNEYEEWYFAIFMLAALCALIVLAVVLWREDGAAHTPGLAFLRTVYYLALPLVLCENLRSECMKWGFVKCEMLLCGAALFIILWLHCVQGVKKGLGRWTVPMMILLLVVGIIAFEVILTAFSWYQKIRWYLLIGYTVLLALLPLMGRWVVLLIAGLLMVGIVGTVVILDKLSWPPVYGYAIMMGLLAALAGLECFAVSRRIVKE